MNKLHKTMKELPSSEQPYEKAVLYGLHSLSDGELLAVMLRTGTKEARSLEVAMNLLDCHDTYKGLIGLHYLTMEDYLKVSGIGKVKATQLLCISELTKRLSRATRTMGVSFHNPREIADYFMEEMRVLQTEHIYLLLLGGNSSLIKHLIVSNGSVNASIASPREILRLALRYDAVNIVLLHNHPSGDPSPSREDVKVTKRLLEASELMGIPLIDHIIIGDRQYVSLKERGYM